MKKVLFLIVFCIATSFVIAEEQSALDQRILQRCNTQIAQYRANKTVDNEIVATECAYNAAKYYKLDIMPMAKSLSYLYATKYQNSANNPQYLDKMYQYSFIALRNGSKDPIIAESAVFQAIIKQNIKDLDYAYELLCNIAPQKAQQIKADVVDARNQIQKQNEQNTANTINNITKILESDAVQDMLSGSSWDELEGRFMTPSERRARNNALIQQGTSYEQLLMQKRQTDALQNINNSLYNINNNLDGLRYGY